jgi:hypothetical protein
VYQLDYSGNGGELTVEAQRTKKRNNARFNIMDFLIVLIVLLCVFSLVARYTTVLDKIGISDHLEEYEISFTVSDLRYTTPNFFRIDDDIYLSDDDHAYVGKLLSREIGSTDALTITLSSQYVQTETGFVSAYYAENTFVDVAGRILCRGSINADGYFMLNGNAYLSEGQTVSVCTDLVSFEMIVTDISPAA